MLTTCSTWFWNFNHYIFFVNFNFFFCRFQNNNKSGWFFWFKYFSYCSRKTLQIFKNILTFNLNSWTCLWFQNILIFKILTISILLKHLFDIINKQTISLFDWNFNLNFLISFWTTFHISLFCLFKNFFFENFKFLSFFLKVCLFFWSCCRFCKFDSYQLFITKLFIFLKKQNYRAEFFMLNTIVLKKFIVCHNFNRRQKFFTFIKLMF